MNDTSTLAATGSPAHGISAAVNELVQAAGVDRAIELVDKDFAGIDAATASPLPPDWLRSSENLSTDEPTSWEDSVTSATRTGIVRSYRTERITGVEVTSNSLEGLRFTHKDNLGVAGYPISAGNPALSNRRSTLTSPLLEAVEAAGGHIVGANLMAEFAMSPTGHNHWLGDGVNPLTDSHLSGGSSSGSAIAVAKGTCDVSFGTDTGGSVRLPASFCGLIGYKPTNGLFSHTALIPLSETLDTIGIIARDVDDVITTLRVLIDDENVVAPEKKSALDANLNSAGNESFRYLAAAAVRQACDHDVAAGYEKAVRAIGESHLAEVDIDFSDLERKSDVIVSVEAARNVGRILDWDWDHLGDQVLSRVIRGTAMPALTYADALSTRALAARNFVDEHFGDARFLITPTSPICAPRVLDDENQTELLVRQDFMRASKYTRTINYLDLPAVTIPLPSDQSQLRPGLQIIGRACDDLALLACAKQLSVAMTK